MAAPTVIQGDLHVTGTVTGGSLTPSALTVTNASVSSTAAIAATKLEHQFALSYTQNGTAASATIPLHVAYGAGTIVAIKAASIAIAVGAATVTVDLKKGGTTCLSGVITLDSGNTARTSEAGSLTVTTYSADNFLELVIVATAGGGTLPTGLIVTVILRENAAP